MYQKHPFHRRLAGWAARGALLYLIIVLSVWLAGVGKTQCPLCGGPIYFAFFRFCFCR